MNSVARNLTFISVSAGLGMYSTFNTSFSALDLTTAETVQGRAAQTLESRFETALPIREIGINFWSAVRYVLFEEGDSGVVIGNDGWLFTAEEFFSPVDGEENLATNLKTIAAIQDEFATQNIELVVVPVPSKARVRQVNTSQTPDALHQSLYPNFLRFLEGQAIDHVDTASLFAERGGDLFFKTDTHWLPEAAALTATGLSSYRLATNEENFSVVNVEHQALQGDLVNFISLDPWFSNIAPAPESLITFDVANSLELDLFADLPTPEVALVGTSYSANSQWNFEGALKLALDEDVMNFATEGEGPIVPMLNFIERYLPELPDLRLVVWEIPERYLSQPYPSRVPANLSGLALN